jgi:hypothetical protein
MEVKSYLTKFYCLQSTNTKKLKSYPLYSSNGIVKSTSENIFSHCVLSSEHTTLYTGFIDPHGDMSTETIQSK